MATVRSATVAVETRPGWKTTEFWVVMVGFVLGCIQEAVGVFHVSDARVTTILGALLSAYAIARGLAKAGVPNVVPETPSITTTSSAPTSDRVA